MDFGNVGADERRLRLRKRLRLRCSWRTRFLNLALNPNLNLSVQNIMCGIIGYVGKKSASSILLEGLRRLEYRGYDSAGIAVLRDGRLTVRKKKGKIDEGLAHLLVQQPLVGN